MRKLSKDKAMLIAEYANYVQRHAQYEQALMQAISNKAPEETRKRLIIGATWAAKEAMFAAGHLGLSRDYIQGDILQRAG